MKRTLILLASAGALMITAPTVTAQLGDEAVAEQVSKPSGTFQKKRYSIKGDWEIVKVNGKDAIRFSDNFKTKSGPDLKIFLSKSSVDTLSGKTVQNNAVKISVLKSNKGGQTYELPEGVSLDDYKSVLIHCEAYSVLWGGFDIPE